jgi:hypothetical protein
MLQLDNQTPFYPFIAVLPNCDAIDTLYVVIKATLVLRPKLALGPVQIPTTLADEYYGDPITSSLKQVSEMHIGKVGTDVLLVGRAWTPNAQAAPEAWVRVSVAERQKTVRVFGDRTWTRDGTPSAARPSHASVLCTDGGALDATPCFRGHV